MVLIPYLDGERTPDLPDATGTLVGMTARQHDAATMARAAIEGMLCGLADAVDALGPRDGGRVLLIGGAAASPAVRTVAPTLFGGTVHVPAAGEYVALGAARQAAWAHSGADAPPRVGRRGRARGARGPRPGGPGGLRGRPGGRGLLTAPRGALTHLGTF